ncbi:MAG TPA: chorismate mutase [Gemmatimonadales bacterium]|nr:chorismate mutase [Gemmatimonadales bacterium]
MSESELDRPRAEIERIDRALIGLIEERVRAAHRAAEAKRAAGLPTLDPAQEAAVIRRAAALARDAGLPEEDVRDLFWHIVGLTRRAEREGSDAPTQQRQL